MTNRSTTTSTIVGAAFLTLACLIPTANCLAASGQEIDVRVNDALSRLKTEVSASTPLLAKAAGVLVFPKVLKAGIGIGGEYGEGALRINGKTTEYYSTAAASVGWQLGAQSKAVFVLFMTKDALATFRTSSGWKAGVDGSISLVKIGAAGAIDTETTKAPVIGFVLTNTGLMYNLTLEGSKYTKIVR